MSNTIVVFLFVSICSIDVWGQVGTAAVYCSMCCQWLASHKLKTVTHVDVHEAGTLQHNHYVYRRGVIIKNVCLPLRFPAEHVRLSEDTRGSLFTPVWSVMGLFSLKPASLKLILVKWVDNGFTLWWTATRNWLYGKSCLQWHCVILTRWYLCTFCARVFQIYSCYLHIVGGSISISKGQSGVFLLK